MNFYIVTNYKCFNRLFIFLLLLNCYSLTTGCKKFVDVQAPYTNVNSENVYTNDATATAVLNGLYTQISNTRFDDIALSLSSLSAYLGLAADELRLWDGISSSFDLINQTRYAYYTNSLSATKIHNYGSEFFSSFYNSIYTCNSVIEALTNNSSLSPQVKQQLLGEAKFMRALFYFYLVSLYGDVPLILSTDFKINSAIARSSVNEVYENVIKDLKEAQDLLSSNYIDATLTNTTTERTRPNKWVATALLSRVYLFVGQWQNAETEASTLINQPALFSLVNLSNTFLKNNEEAIWQLQPVVSDWNTEDAKLFIFPTSDGPTSSNPVFLSQDLVSSFESGDNRKSWIDSLSIDSVKYYFPYKYKSATEGASVTEYLTVFRLAEQYLIRSEARAQMDKVTESISDLNVIRTRAGLSNTSANDKNSILAAILNERRYELFTEWGHRWLDLKRTQNIDAVMSVETPKKSGSNWLPSQKLFPLPFDDIQRNPNLAQNNGY